VPTPQKQPVSYEQPIDRLARKACLVLKVSRFVIHEHVIDGIGNSPVDFAVDTVVLYLDGKGSLHRR
jgi:hypothetical protein